MKLGLTEEVNNFKLHTLEEIKSSKKNIMYLNYSQEQEVWHLAYIKQA